jgi:hypothetical protein
MSANGPKQNLKIDIRRAGNEVNLKHRWRTEDLREVGVEYLSGGSEAAHPWPR